MLTYPHIDPVALQIGPLAIHWYGLTYLAAFGLFMLLGTRRLRHEPFASITGPGAWSRKDVEDILFLGVAGVVVGGRLGYRAAAAGPSGAGWRGFGLPRRWAGTAGRAGRRRPGPPYSWQGQSP